MSAVLRKKCDPDNFEFSASRRNSLKSIFVVKATKNGFCHNYVFLR